MSIAKYAMTHKRVIHFFLIFVLLGGILSFPKLGKKEDAPFVIKEAVLLTKYPGASAKEVEELVTEVIERKIQAARGYDWMKSESRAGSSYIKIAFFESIAKEEFNQIWDELRRKVEDVQAELPPGCMPTQINDDFGDVFGVYYALTADDGFEYSELEDYAEVIRRELVPISEISKVELFGIQPKVINIEITESKLVNAGVTPEMLVNTIQSQNRLIKSGDLTMQNNQIRVEAPGTFQSVEEIENLIITGTGGNPLRIKDLADVSKDYLDPPLTKMRLNGKRAIGIGISTRLGGNSVLMGELANVKLNEIESLLPIGIELEGIYFENEVALEANVDFIINLALAIVIVIVIILFAMGVRSSILIGSSLLFSILGALIFMLLLGIELHRTSLAAIIVALGMLVDNAIVVTDNASINMKRGMNKVDAFIQGASVPQWGLLGATFIAIVSFLPLYLAPNNTAEIIKPLFIVLAISLGLSWIFALIQTTTYGDLIIKEPSKEEANKDPYDSKFYTWLQNLIEKMIAWRWVSLSIVVVLFIVSLKLFGTVEQAFFPAINKPMFKVDYFLPQGTQLEVAQQDMEVIEEFLLAKEEVVQVSITLGAPPLRYYLATTSFSASPTYSNLLIETQDYKQANDLMYELNEFIKDNLPNGMAIFYKFKVSPYPDGIIEPTVLGPDPEVLFEIGEQIKKIMREEPLVENIRTNWREKSMVWNPIYSQNKGQRRGISRDAMANAILRVTDGMQIGEYREGDDSFPILLKDANRKDYDFNNIGSLSIYNSQGKSVPLDQIVEGYDVKWESNLINRRNRQRALAIQSDPIWGVENPEVEAVLMPKINALELPEGYSIFWDGMYKKQLDTNVAVMGQLPVTFFLIAAILVILYNSYRKVVILFLMIPMIMIGITAGFLLTGQAFGFFGLLGVLGLIGMVLKNGIVLLDQAELEMTERNLSEFDAIVAAAVHRAIPVFLAAGTTVLGMVPLLPDPMFGGMAATIMGGLTVAAILTILILPVLYATFYKLKKTENKK